MARTQSFKKILELKKDKVREVVNRICAKRGIPLPYINFEYCSEENQSQLAHYHPDTNTICISERQLIMQNFDDLEKVVAHEVSHILVQDHSSNFKQQEVISSIAGLQLPSGIVHITGNEKSVKKERKIKQDKTRCNYHLCRKKRKLTRCKYCKNYYCLEHIAPSEPSMYNERTAFDKIEGHPCAAYAINLEEKQKEANIKYSEALTQMLARKKRVFVVPPHTEQPKEERGIDRYEPFIPVRTEPTSHSSFSRGNFSFENFLRKYVYFRIPPWVNPYFMQFLLVFIVGIVLNYVYFHSISIRYLFIDGLNTWFNTLNQTLTYGLHGAYTLIYLIINGIYYGYFYYNFVMVIFKTLKHLDKRDTWVMLGWFALIIWLMAHFFPQII